MMNISPVVNSAIKGTLLKSIGSCFRIKDSMQEHRAVKKEEVRELSNLALVCLANIILLPLTKKVNIPDFYAWGFTYTASEIASRKIASKLDIRA
jgi:hypothetical protein